MMLNILMGAVRARVEERLGVPLLRSAVQRLRARVDDAEAKVERQARAAGQAEVDNQALKQQLAECTRDREVLRYEVGDLASRLRQADLRVQYLEKQVAQLESQRKDDAVVNGILNNSLKAEMELTERAEEALREAARKLEAAGLADAAAAALEALLPRRVQP